MHLSVDDLARRYRAAKEPHERSWWQILWLLARGQTAVQIAQSTGYTARWIGQLAKRYNDEGPAGMTNRQHTHSRRQSPLLSAEQEAALRAALAGPAPGDGQWSGPAVAAWMAARLGRPVNRQRGYRYLMRLKAKPLAPRPRHAQADPAAQAAFKKTSVRC